MIQCPLYILNVVVCLSTLLNNKHKYSNLWVVELTERNLRPDKTKPHTVKSLYYALIKSSTFKIIDANSYV